MVFSWPEICTLHSKKVLKIGLHTPTGSSVATYALSSVLECTAGKYLHQPMDIDITKTINKDEYSWSLLIAAVCN